MKIFGTATVIVILLVVLGCGGAKQPAEETAQECVPFGVEASVDDGVISVSFVDDCTRLKSGYNIYVSREPLAQRFPGDSLPPGVEPHNHAVFPGDTNPEDNVERYDAEGVENGTVCYVHVRTVFPDRGVSKPSNEVRVIPGPRGEITLSQSYESEQDGFSFARDSYVRADALENDLYYTAQYTQVTGKDFLASPSRLGFLRESKFRVLEGEGNLDEVAQRLDRNSPLPLDERVPVQQGDWVEILTQDNTFALVKVLGFEGTGEDRRIKLYYAYSPAAAGPLF